MDVITAAAPIALAALTLGVPARHSANIVIMRSGVHAIFAMMRFGSKSEQ